MSKPAKGGSLNKDKNWEDLNIFTMYQETGQKFDDRIYGRWDQKSAKGCFPYKDNEITRHSAKDGCLNKDTNSR